MRWSISRERGLYPERGLGLWWSGGCLGSTYGEPGANHFLYIYLLFLRWQWALRFSWKVL